MRRMYSESELRTFIKNYIRENGDDVVASLVGKDLSIEGLTSKGIANTGGLANIGNVAISGDLNVQGEGEGNITANTLKQRQSNWEIDLSSALTPNIFASGSTIFSKMALYNRTLHLVISGKYVQGSLTSGNSNLIYEKTLDIPDEIASKIYRADGTNLTEAPTSTSNQNNIICSFSGVRITNNATQFYGYLLSNSAKTISLYAIGLGTLTQGETYWLDLRLFLSI